MSEAPRTLTEIGLWLGDTWDEASLLAEHSDTSVKLGTHLGKLAAAACEALQVIQVEIGAKLLQQKRDESDMAPRTLNSASQYMLASVRKTPDGLFVGLCPFHDDGRETLIVNEIQRSYSCSACDAAGRLDGPGKLGTWNRYTFALVC